MTFQINDINQHYYSESRHPSFKGLTIESRSKQDQISGSGIIWVYFNIMLEQFFFFFFFENMFSIRTYSQGK